MFNLLLLLVSQTNDVLKVPDGIEADVKTWEATIPSLHSICSPPWGMQRILRGAVLWASPCIVNTPASVHRHKHCDCEVNLMDLFFAFFFFILTTFWSFPASKGSVSLGVLLPDYSTVSEAEVAKWFLARLLSERSPSENSLCPGIYSTLWCSNQQT